MHIRFIPQKNRSSGCGPACIAMIAGPKFSRSPKAAYSKAVKLIFGSDQTRDLYTGWNDLREALYALGIGHADRIHRHRSWQAITTLSIVKCGQQQDGRWHWVVYDGRIGLLYDPLRDGPVEPNGRMRQPRSHLPILG